MKLKPRKKFHNLLLKTNSKPGDKFFINLFSIYQLILIQLHWFFDDKPLVVILQLQLYP